VPKSGMVLLSDYPGMLKAMLQTNPRNTVIDMKPHTKALLEPQLIDLTHETSTTSSLRSRV